MYYSYNTISVLAIYTVHAHDTVWLLSSNLKTLIIRHSSQHCRVERPRHIVRSATWLHRPNLLQQRLHSHHLRVSSGLLRSWTESWKPFSMNYPRVQTEMRGWSYWWKQHPSIQDTLQLLFARRYWKSIIHQTHSMKITVIRSAFSYIVIISEVTRQETISGPCQPNVDVFGTTRGQPLTPCTLRR